MEPLTDAPPDPLTPPGAAQQVAALYQAHALGLVTQGKLIPLLPATFPVEQGPGTIAF